jgi:hypothetical protein
MDLALFIAGWSWVMAACVAILFFREQQRRREVESRIVAWMKLQDSINRDLAKLRQTIRVNEFNPN